MINCPKCQVPNSDTSAVCAACGTSLAGQQLAQAMDHAQQQMSQTAAPAAAPPPPPGQPPAGYAPQPAPGQAPAPYGQAMAPAPPAPSMPPAPVQPRFAGVPEMVAPIGAPMDAATAQMEINKFLAEQKARKRMKALMYLVVVMIIAGVLGFVYLRDARKKARIKEVAEFFSAFRLVDDEETATFWKCTVRARHRDVRLARDTLEITDGLEKAFQNFPKSQPEYLKEKCIPQITGILASLEKLKPPAGFEEALEAVKQSMKKVAAVFTTYANKIAQRKDEASNEQEVRDAVGEFHLAQSQSEVPKALEYYNILKCAIPELEKQVKAISKPPDTQPVVEYIYNTCKADPTFADKLRKECFDKRKENVEKDAGYKAAVYKMSGDNRDLSAINDCFSRANRGFDREEIEAVAKVFVDYRGARGEIIKALAQVKKETSE